MFSHKNQYNSKQSICATKRKLTKRHISN